MQKPSQISPYKGFFLLYITPLVRITLGKIINNVHCLLICLLVDLGDAVVGVVDDVAVVVRAVVLI